MQRGIRFMHKYAQNALKRFQISISNNKCNSGFFILVHTFDAGLMLFVVLLLSQGNKVAGYLLTSFVVCCHCRLVRSTRVGSYYPLVTGSHNWTSCQPGRNRQRPVSEEHPQRHLLVNPRMFLSPFCYFILFCCKS